MMKNIFDKNKHKQDIKKGHEAMDCIKEKVRDHFWYPKFHIAPPANWMNDPNGFSYFKGEYHLFYQHYPFAPVWGPMHWGHVKSKDLVNWEHMPIALAPGESYDADGCFSGSAYEVNDQLYLMYTGHVKTGIDPENDLKQTQAIASSHDGIVFEKIDGNPIISNLPEGDFHPAHFRDPKVWKHEDFYYAIIGSKSKDGLRGQVVLYKSKDFLHWDFVNTVSKARGNEGTMWECPDLFPLGNQHILIVSPQGIEPEGIYYHNHHQSGYFIGDFSYDKGLLDHGEFHLLDYGFDFYAPQTVLDPKGRRVLIAWMMMWESEIPTKEFGWAGAMTIPRLLEMSERGLLMRPLPELENLRENEVLYTDIKIEQPMALPDVSGDCIELLLEVALGDASGFGMKMRASQCGDEETDLFYDAFNQRLTLNRNKSGKGEKGTRSIDLKSKVEKIKLQIFIDKSSIEVFVNDGEQVLTAMIFPKETSKEIYFYAMGEVVLVDLKKWDIKESIG